MTAPDRYQWRRDKDGLGVWSTVARSQWPVSDIRRSTVAGRRLDGQDARCLLHPGLPEGDERAGVTPDQIDGVICCDSHIAGGSGGSASQWRLGRTSRRPYDSEWGLTLVQRAVAHRADGADQRQICADRVADHQRNGGHGGKAVGDGMCHTCLVIYPTGNLEGRYRRGGENADDYARGGSPMDGALGQSWRQRFHQHVPARSVLPEIRWQARRPRAVRHQPASQRAAHAWGYNATHKVRSSPSRITSVRATC